MPTEPRPTLPIAVLYERERQPNRWQEWRFRLVDVQVDEGQFGTEARTLRDDGSTRLFVHPGRPLTLFRDECEGYYLNLTSGAPAWFVMWRTVEADPSELTTEFVTVSYNEAGRLLDAQEQVENVPLPAPVCEWLAAYTDAHYEPEVKKRKRPVSFKAPHER
ncbi:MAG: DUF3305 domain-containing protein [Rubrivivax sp.]